MRFHFSFRYVLLVFLVFLLCVIGFLLAVNYYFIPKIYDCVFVDKIICLKGRKFEKYNWKGNLTATAFNFSQPQKIKAPFDGLFLYSISGSINYEGKTVGETPVLVFKNDKLGKIKLYVSGAGLLVGDIGVESEVKKGEVVAEVFPEPIRFLGNHNLIRVNLPQ